MYLCKLKFRNEFSKIMDKSTFTNKLQNPFNYTLKEKLEIQAAKTQFPYCSLLQQMDLMSNKAAAIYNWESRFVPRVSAFLLDPSSLGEKLDKVQPTSITTPEELALKRQIEEQKRAESNSGEPESFDVMREINSYQEVSFKTAPKSEILSKFLEDGNCPAGESGEIDTTSIEILGKKSITSESSVETETMAVIFEKQGKFDRAIAIYEKLIPKYPEKSSTFAARINELKNKIELNNK